MDFPEPFQALANSRHFLSTGSDLGHWIPVICIRCDPIPVGGRGLELSVDLPRQAGKANLLLPTLHPDGVNPLIPNATLRHPA
jgi:hypothetical protein